jgi:hypothetical protein
LFEIYLSQGVNRYKGQFIDNEYNGEGIFKSSNGRIYTGKPDDDVLLILLFYCVSCFVVV